MDCAKLTDMQQKIFENDETALAELYKIYKRKLKQFSKSIVHSNDLAEEIVEDVFIKLWRNRADISKIENLNIYLYTAIKNTSLNILSQKAKQLVSTPFDVLNIELFNESHIPSTLMITNEMTQRMQLAMDALPPRCKMIFKLVREDGLKYKEVAQILNISVNTIDTQMAIAIKKICTALQLKQSKKGYKKITHREF